jgi:hypothetical protein
MSPPKLEILDNPAVAPPVLWWLRMEGLVVAALSAVLYARTGSPWWVFGALWLAPDASFLAYLAGPRWGALGYNLVHAYVFPAAFAAFAIVLDKPVVLPVIFIWFNHIGVDRSLGYGLKYPAGFGYTHLMRTRK